MTFPESQMSLLEARAGPVEVNDGTEMLPGSQLSSSEAESCWLGLATDNRRLFDALQDGWLRPRPSDGQVLGIRAYARDGNPPDTGHPIHVQVKFDPAKLPELGIQVLHEKNWRPSYIKALEPTDQALYWPGALPTFAISELSVPTEEERTRFTGMAKFASNLVLPEVPVKLGTKPEDCFDVDVSPPQVEVDIGIPCDLDAIHGAIAMAVWGVPRIAPWLDILTAGFDQKESDMADLAGKVDAPWWRFPPWAQNRDDINPEDSQDRLWLAAIKVFRNQRTGDRINPRWLLEQIYETASQGYPAGGQENEAREWLERTTRILRAESTIQLQNWRSCPVGIAIQLVLTRPKPMNFKTWFKDMPQLPPAIAWSAAALCGLLHGYRHLDCQFRGTSLQRELLSIHALRLSAVGLRDICWPSVNARKPEWRKTADGIVLSWDGHDFSIKTEHERGRWFDANFKNTTVQEEARKLAIELDWRRCFTKELILKDVQLPCSGPGIVRQSLEPDASIRIEGELKIHLPENPKIEKKLDSERFRRLISTEAGLLPPPPVSLPETEAQSQHPVIPGLTYVPGFLSADEEDDLVNIIDSLPWNTELRRRVQHYGWRYDYKARQIDPSMFLGPLPEWAAKLAHRLESEGLVRDLPDQLIVNEYTAEQGISPHVDSDSFADGVVMISLLESWGMVFRKKGVKDKIEQLLERRSATVLRGEARYDWTHEIPKRKTDPSSPGKKRNIRNRRISLTFRKVN